MGSYPVFQHPLRRGGPVLLRLVRQRRALLQELQAQGGAEEVRQHRDRGARDAPRAQTSVVFSASREAGEEEDVSVMSLRRDEVGGSERPTVEMKESDYHQCCELVDNFSISLQANFEELDHVHSTYYIPRRILLATMLKVEPSKLHVLAQKCPHLGLEKLVRHGVCFCTRDLGNVTTTPERRGSGIVRPLCSTI